MIKNVDGFYVSSISKKDPTGCIIDVDLKYPDELHLLHNDYPLAPNNSISWVTKFKFG